MRPPHRQWRWPHEQLRAQAEAGAAEHQVGALQIENKIRAVVNYDLAQACRWCDREASVEGRVVKVSCSVSVVGIRS
jgi:hypothetical protein